MNPLHVNQEDVSIPPPQSQLNCERFDIRTRRSESRRDCGEGGEKEEKIQDWISYTYKNDLIGPPAWRQWHLHPRADKRETTDSRDTSAESAHRPRSGPLWWASTAAGSLVSQRHKWEVRLNREWRMVHARPLPRKNSLSLSLFLYSARARAER